MDELFRCAVYPIVNVDDHSDALSYALRLLDARPSILQLRAKQCADRELLALARSLVPRCRDASCKLIINDRADICQLAGADGVHVGQDDLPPQAIRQLLPHAIIGFSTHNIEQFLAAPFELLNYAALGPIFLSSTKSGHAPVVGLEKLREVATKAPLPLVAIGGINAENATAVFQSGARAIALVSDLQKAERPAELIAKYQQAFQSALGS